MGFEQDIKRMRLEKGLTQQELAESIHVSRQTVSTWETGKNYPSLEVLRSLSLLFNVSFEQIIFGEKPTMADNKEVNIATTIDTDILLKHKYKRISLFLGVILSLVAIWAITLAIGYHNGISQIDRFNPFLQYQVGYTKLPNDDVINPRNHTNRGYWTRWFSDNEMGTSWSKLTVTTGLNPGLKEPYVMAYHKGSYVKIARIVPGEAVNTVSKSNVAAINQLAYSKKHDNLSVNTSSEEALKQTLKNTVHFSQAIQEMVVE